MNLLDLVILVLVGLSALNGYRRGAALQLFTYAGLLLGLLTGAILAPPAAALVHSPLTQAVVALTVLLSMAGLGDAIGWAIGAHIWRLARQTVVGAVDAAAGSIVAVLAVLVAVWFIGFNLVNGPFPSLSRQIRGSAIERSLTGAFPRPPSVVAEFRQFLDRFGFPEVFADLPPAPAGPVDGPTKGQVAHVAGEVQDSTVRIVGAACGVLQEGSGFVAAVHYVVTNAHVVAGVRRPQVQVQNGRSQEGVTVLFDPKLDIAILRIDAAPGPVLPLDQDDAGRGSKGAVLGFPGGGNLAYGPAAVRRELSATGRDIYGRSVVERDVYELQAIVRPGNSGGPFVLLDGHVAGVVFAASTTDNHVGYAIASPAVADRLHQAVGRTDPVSTQTCAR